MEVERQMLYGQGTPAGNVHPCQERDALTLVVLLCYHRGFSDGQLVRPGGLGVKGPVFQKRQGCDALGVVCASGPCVSLTPAVHSSAVAVQPLS